MCIRNLSVLVFLYLLILNEGVFAAPRLKNPDYKLASELLQNLLLDDDSVKHKLQWLVDLEKEISYNQISKETFSLYQKKLKKNYAQVSESLREESGINLFAIPDYNTRKEIIKNKFKDIAGNKSSKTMMAIDDLNNMAKAFMKFIIEQFTHAGYKLFLREDEKLANDMSLRRHVISIFSQDLSMLVSWSMEFELYDFRLDLFVETKLFEKDNHAEIDISSFKKNSLPLETGAKLSSVNRPLELRTILFLYNFHLDRNAVGFSIYGNSIGGRDAPIISRNIYFNNPKDLLNYLSLDDQSYKKFQGESQKYFSRLLGKSTEKLLKHSRDLKIQNTIADEIRKLQILKIETPSKKWTNPFWLQGE